MCAPSARVSELAKNWAKDGHDVTIITAMPNHPDGIIHPKYKWEYFTEEYSNNIRILRVILYVTPNKGFIKRIFSFISFMITALVTGLYVNKPDVVVATSPQLFVGVSGYIISRLRRIPFVFEVRDIWPQSAIDLKMLRIRMIIHLMEKLERFLYAKSALIVTTTPVQRMNILKKCFTGKIVECIPNGVDAERFNVTEKKNIIWKDGVKKGFAVAYIGTIGLSHNLDILVQAASILKNKNIYFFIIGDGAQKEKIRESISQKRLTNIFLWDKIPLEMVPYAMLEVDAGLAHERDLPMAREMYPAKMFDVMASGKPLIIGIHGAAKELVEKNKTGIVFKSDSVDDLVRAIEKLASNPSLCMELGQNGKNLVYREYNRESQAREYASLIERCLTK